MTETPTVPSLRSLPVYMLRENDMVFADDRQWFFRVPADGGTPIGFGLVLDESVEVLVAASCTDADAFNDQRRRHKLSVSVPPPAKNGADQ